MSAVLIILVLLFTAFVLATFFWKRDSHQKYLPETPFVVPNSLFDPPSAQIMAALDAEMLRTELLNRANEGDYSALTQAKSDQVLYGEVLETLAGHDLHGVAAYIAGNDELRANAQFAKALIEAWRQAPTRNELGRMLHLAALSDDAEIYFLAVKTTMQAWREQKIQDVSAQELAAVIEAEYWLLKPSARETKMALKDFLTKVGREFRVSPSGDTLNSH